jgi:hypothetical protein
MEISQSERPLSATSGRRDHINSAFLASSSLPDGQIQK